jgi:hypothetical protein
LLAELAELQDAAPAQPANAVDLIQYLPETTLDLAAIPHHLLRQLCDAFALSVTYNKHTHQAAFKIDIAAHTIPRVQQLAIASPTDAARHTRTVLYGAPPGARWGNINSRAAGTRRHL